MDFAVSRPRLLAAMDAARGRGLTLLSSPPGYGKTTLLRKWRAETSHPTVGLAVTARDNAPGRLLARLTGAVMGKTSTRLPELINSLAGTGPLALIIDNYQEISSPAAHGLMTHLLEVLPPETRLVVATQVTPLFPLGRLRVRGQLVELRARELALTWEETKAHALATRPDLSENAIEQIYAQTRGWAWGLRYLLGQEAALPFERIFERQPAATRDFLLATASLPVLNAEACNAATDRHDGQSMLERLDTHNLFVLPLDDERGAYTYHPMFADFLKGKAVPPSPTLVVDRIP